MATDKSKEDKGVKLEDGEEIIKTSWFTPSTEFRREPLTPLRESQGVDTIENPARPPTSGKYRLTNGSGKWGPLGSLSSSARIVDKPGGVQQDLRMPGPEDGDYRHRRIRSELSGPSQSIGRIHDIDGQKYITPSNQEEGDGTGSSGAPGRGGRGPFCFGDLPLPPNHRMHKSGLGLIPEDGARTFSLGHTRSRSRVISVGRSEDISSARTKSCDCSMYKSLESDGNAKLSYSGQVLMGGEGEVPSYSGDTNSKGIHSKPGTGSYLPFSSAVPQRGYQPHIPDLSEFIATQPEYTSEQVARDYMSDYIASGIPSEGPLLTLLCDKVIKEAQRCDGLVLTIKRLKAELARVMRQSHLFEQSMLELSSQLELIGPRLDLSEAQKVVDRDVAAILASGGIPPLDITLDGWTYIRIGEPGNSLDGAKSSAIGPFPHGSGDRSSPLLPSPPKRPSFAGSPGPAPLQPAPMRPSAVGSRDLSPPDLSRKRHTWAGNNRSSPEEPSTPRRFTRASSFVSPPRPTRRHDGASASPGISSRYFNWIPVEKRKGKNN